MTALAAAGGAAVVHAAGSDEWEGLRSRLARWLSRGDAERERGELERLNHSAAELAAAAMTDRVRARHEAAWQTRIETLLEDLDDDQQRDEAAAQLHQLLREVASSASGGGGLVSRNFHGPTALQTGARNLQVNQFVHGPVGHTPPGPENDPDDDWPEET
ncbi:hypothetical protein [Streptomyces lavendofoliae]|uniref:hypothetical protein n=1 Tax=Streptomyces lavendofoliae TaxID=67314 RepID=UPI003D90E717